MKLSTYAYLLLLFVFASCTETFDLKTKEVPPQLVVDAELSSEKKAHTVKLSLTNDVFDDTPNPKVTGALVEITSETETISFTETEPGIYQTADTVQGQLNSTYTLSINYDGETYTSTSTLKPVADIECSFLVKADSSNVFLRDNYIILMAATETPGIGDNYLWNWYRNDTLITDTVGNKFYGNDDLIDGEDFTKSIIFFVPPSEVDPVNDDLVLEMKSISPEYFDFLYALQLAAFRGSPFDGPPANAPSNISNNAVGFFITTDVKRKTVCALLEEEPYFNNCDFGCLELAFSIFGE